MGGERLPSVRGGRVLTSESGVRIRILERCPRGGVYARVLAGGRVPTGAELR